jgi:DNA repair exonuclease SbcCD ATPase subunit
MGEAALQSSNMLTPLSSTYGAGQYEHIVHLGDVHVKLNKRHDEYRKAFDKFFESIDDLPQDKTCICCLGDIFATKLDLQPEAIDTCHYLLRGCADRFATILVAGNHDFLMSNRARMDSITPIVDAINHPNLFYLKESGLYGLGNILFNNYSIFDEASKYLPAASIPKVYLNKYNHLIALYHGTVDSIVNDMGYVIVNAEIKKEIFDGHHIALLGDIHKGQDLQLFDDSGPVTKPIIRYCGSTLQQNHGEPLHGHGYSLWSLDDRSYQHVELPNEYGYFTIDIDHGKLTTDLSTLPSKCRLRVRCIESVVTEVKAVVTDIRGKSEVKEIVYERIPTADDKKALTISAGDLDLADLEKLDHQDALLTKYLKGKLKVDDEEKIAAVLAVNKELNDTLPKEDAVPNIRWKPKKFEWSNMFSYGEGNVVDFSKLKGIYGLFAKNAAGKSSILSSLCFCLFDKTDRVNKASDVLNIQKSTFSCKFNFEIDGIDYFIERKGTSDRKGDVKVDVEFWKLGADGNKVSLNGEKRSDTNKKIRDYLGTYEDFILTSLSVQNVKNASSFIDMGHSERKDVLSQFIGLGIFDRLHDSASDKLNELSAGLKVFKKEDETQRLADLQRLSEQMSTIHTQIVESKSSLTDKRTLLNNAIATESSNLIKVDDSVGNWTEEQILSNVTKFVNSRTQSETNLSTLKNDALSKLPAIQQSISTKADELAKIDDTITSLENKNIVDAYKKYQTFQSEYNRLKNEMDRLLITIKGQQEKISHLSKHEYDPNCKYCVNNVFVVDAIRTKGELSLNETKRADLDNKVNEAKKVADEYQWAVTEQNTYTSWLTKRNKSKDELTLLQLKVDNINNSIIGWERTSTQEIAKAVENIKLWEDRLKKFRDNKDAIQSNFKVEANIFSLRRELKEVEDKISESDKSITSAVSRIQVAASQIEQINAKIINAIKTEKDIEAYTLYLKAICRDGIPYDLICGAVPEIEREVNVILNQIVEFHAKFETDGKNIVPYISYGDRQWAMGLSSGFEKFVLGLAIRIALINVSNLPRPSYMVIDEGWGTADADNLAGMPALFSFLRSTFEFILIISHLDVMRDAVDGTIDISKENDFSHVNFV